jgi:hypothetical protein
MQTKQNPIKINKIVEADKKIDTESIKQKLPRMQSSLSGRVDFNNIPPYPINNDCIRRITIVIDSAITAKKIAEEIDVLCTSLPYTSGCLIPLCHTLNNYHQSMQMVYSNIIFLKDEVADDTVTTAINYATEMVSIAIKSSLERYVVINEMSTSRSINMNIIYDITSNCLDESKKAFEAITLVQNKANTVNAYAIINALRANLLRVNVW